MMPPCGPWQLDLLSIFTAFWSACHCPKQNTCESRRQREHKTGQHSIESCVSSRVALPSRRLWLSFIAASASISLGWKKPTMFLVFFKNTFELVRYGTFGTKMNEVTRAVRAIVHDIASLLVCTAWYGFLFDGSHTRCLVLRSEGSPTCEPQIVSFFLTAMCSRCD